MKKLISTVLSLQLLLPQMVFAQAANQTNQPNQSVQAATQTADAGSNANYDAQSQAQGGYDFYAKQILALGTSIVGANIISQCPKGVMVPSIGTYMAGSAVHIVSEFAAAKAQNENHTKNMEEVKKLRELEMMADGNVQKDILIKRKKEEEQTRDFIKSRIMWMKAVTAVYLASAALAIYEETSGHAAGVAVGTSTCSIVAAELASKCSGPHYTACYAKEFAQCTAFMPNGAVTAESNFASPTAPASGEAACTAGVPYSKGCSIYQTAYLTIAYPACTPLSIGSGLSGTIMTKAVVGAYTLGVGNTAQGAISTYGIMLSSLLTLFVPSIQKIVMPAYNFPIPRAVTFGASAATAGVVVAGLSQRLSIAEENIKKIDKVLSEFNLASNDPGGLAPGASVINGSPTGTSDAMNNPKGSDVTALPGVTTTNPKNCVSTNGGTYTYSAASCATPVKYTKPSFDFKNGVLAANNVGLMATDMANAISSGDIDKANVLAGSLSNQASKMKDTLTDLQKQYNAQLKNQGKSAVDFDKEIQHRANESQASLNGIAASKGMGGSDASNKASLAASSDVKTTEDISKNLDSSSSINADNLNLNNSDIDLSKFSQSNLVIYVCSSTRCIRSSTWSSLQSTRRWIFVAIAFIWP
jgi:hypothetical protein